MNLQESIRRILREGGFAPLPIRRRISTDDLEEAFAYSLETNTTHMDNPNTILYKEKKPSLWVFSKFVIDDMVTLIEQEYFTNDNRIYFSDTDEDDETYHEKIRQPLLRYYGKRIKEKYDEVMSSNDEEIIQESIRRILREVRVPRSERVELYKDDNIIVVVPLTHRALQKYATNCQWCINDDLTDWEDYHKGKHAVIIQRNPKKPKIGITGTIATYGEIFILSRLDEGMWDWKTATDILGYDFGGSKEKALDYYVNISNDINNFATNIVYYSPENGIYDQEDNFLWNFDYEITDIPNVTPEVIKIMDDYLQENEEMSLQESIRRILREETRLSTFIRRRVPIDELEQKFNKAIIYATDLYKRRYGHLEGSEGLRVFRRITLAKLMDGIHRMLHSTTNEDRNWYQEALDDLESYYKDRIFDEWEVITN